MRTLTEIIDAAGAIVITAGAGMGVDSGLPDFRGTKGLWREYPELKARRLSFEDMATPHWFESAPELAWAFYGHRLHKYLEVEPHDGFRILLDICKAKDDNYFVVTSNVDGHFQKAGFDPNRIHEVHGSLSYFQCIQGCRGDIWPADNALVRVEEAAFKAVVMPSCPYCGLVARPNVLMFDDWNWLPRRERLQHQRLNAWIRSVQSKPQRVVIIEIGASNAIPTIRNMSDQFYLNRFHPAVDLIRINPRDDSVPQGAISIKSGGLAGIRSLIAADL